MNRKKVLQIGITIFLIVMLATLLGYGIWNKRRLLDQQEREKNARSNKSTISYNGMEYEYNYNLRNVLFIGVDKTDEFNEFEEGYGGQADCLILMSMDKDKKETSLLEISRDSMTDVEVYAQDGTDMGVEHMQIATQYAYGDGEDRSCRLTLNAVSNLLYEIPIHSYIAINIEGIGLITELMGGVEITIPKDYTYIDKSFEKGATLVLKGKLAERYVRYRDVEVVGSNVERMERQTHFLRTMATQLQGREFEWYQNIKEGAEEHIITDLTASEMERLSEYTMNDDIQMVPGEVQAGDKHDEFIVDGEKLKEIVINTLYKQKK